MVIRFRPILCPNVRISSTACSIILPNPINPTIAKALMSVLSEGYHYASDTKLGIGLVAAGNYLADRSTHRPYPPPFRCILIYPPRDSLCSDCVARIYSHPTDGVLTTIYSSILSRPNSGDSISEVSAMMMASRHIVCCPTEPLPRLCGVLAKICSHSRR